MSDMVRGYLAGYSSGSPELPAFLERESAAFRHGWLNGRDDRIGRPRERASVLRARSNLIEHNAGMRVVA